jgi:hypothetical protein
MKKAIQNITVLKPRPSRKRRLIGAPEAVSALGSAKWSPAAAR